MEYHSFSGAKIVDKNNIAINLLKKADNLLIGGAIGNTFLRILRFEIGESLFDDSIKELAMKILKKKEVILVCDILDERYYLLTYRRVSDYVPGTIPEVAASAFRSALRI